MTPDDPRPETKAVPFDSQRFLKQVTRQPGVYQMYDGAGTILYVGKAKNLKNRLASYFHRAGLTPKTQALVKRIHTIEVTVTSSEAEALILEQNLIKSQRPPFNILLRDDKSYPYIFLSDSEPFPRLALHRGPKNKKGRYFGPFPSAGAVRESLQFLQKTFHVRQCEDSVFRNRTRACLQYQIGRCSGPCVNLVSEQDYREDVRHTAMFLDGQSVRLSDELVEQMQQAAEAHDYEQAAVFRDQITALRHVQSQNDAEYGQGDVDVVACATEAGQVCIHVLFIRQGRILGSKSYFPKDPLGESESELLGHFLPQFYIGLRNLDVPAEVVTSHPVEDAAAISAAVGEVASKSFMIHTKVRTHRARWVGMALEAARQNLKSRLNTQQNVLQKLEGLQLLLNLEELPQRIECFDISHSSGEHTVASCVVFDQTGAAKSDYRRFNIQNVQAGDDYAAMEQALMRRYSRLQKEGKPLPSVLLIDGGKGQLSKAKAVKEELGIESVVLLGIAKGTTRKPGFETLITEDGREVALTGNDPVLHLLQQIRDEAHRFAITGHKLARDKRRSRSTLEDIAGVGPKRRRQLINHFGGLQELTRASVDDIAKVQGISRKLAQEVYGVLHRE